MKLPKAKDFPWGASIEFKRPAFYPANMGLFDFVLSVLAPVFLVLSPITSYADQILAMHRTRTSAGFSLDIPLIMIVASILKIFYWPGARFDMSLLVQSLVMLAVQALLLKVALDNRPGWRSEVVVIRDSKEQQRPWGFWRWKNQRLYWQFILLFFVSLLTMHVLIRPSPGTSTGYTNLLGFLGLTIEATLPLPQLHANYTAQSCKGFRASVIANWMFGDAMKMGFFFLSEEGKIPLAFKVCGVFQALCDLGLGAQYLMYGSKNQESRDIHLA